VQRDVDLDLGSAEELRDRLRAKNRHNLVMMALYLLVRWFYVTLLLLIAAVGADVYDTWGLWVVAPANALVVLVGVAYFVLVERAVTRLEALRPHGCSIYDRAFWRHERYWKVPMRTYLQLFNGMPMKSLKGEEVPAHQRWGGNPASTVQEHADELQARPIRINAGATVLVGAE
jgi:hypothetical protein